MIVNADPAALRSLALISVPVIAEASDTSAVAFRATLTQLAAFTALQSLVFTPPAHDVCGSNAHAILRLTQLTLLHCSMPLPLALAGNLTTMRLRDVQLCWQNAAVISDMPSVNAVKLVGGPASAQALESVAELPALRRLDLSSRLPWSLSGTEVPDAVDAARLPAQAVLCLHKLSLLQHLSLAGSSKINSGCMDFLAQLLSCTCLDLSFCRGLDGSALQHLAHMQRLVHLSLARCDRIQSSALAVLPQLTALQSLDLCGCFALNDLACATVATLPVLTRLDLRGCSKVTSSGLLALRQLVRLRWLELSSNTCDGTGVANMSLSLRCLTHLGLYGMRALQGDALRYLQRLPLRHLTLDNAQRLGEAHLRHISALRNLTELALRFVPALTDNGLECLEGLHELRSLTLHRAKSVHGGGLWHLARCAELTALRLQHCESFDACGLAFLSRHTQLQWLEVHKCARVEPVDFVQLPQLAALPDLIVTGMGDADNGAMQAAGFKTA